MVKSTRKSSTLLPEIFQTEQNKKFLSATIDQLIEPTQLEKVSAFIGQRYKPAYRNTDVYLEEISDDRLNYQLEPTVVYKSNKIDIDFASQYIDTVNQISSQGGDKSKHDRLFEQDHYSYSPPVDADKLVNYRHWYWLPQGIPSVRLQPGTPGATVTISVTNDGFAYRFNNKVSVNPDIVLYRGNTYRFKVDALGHNFYIKTQPGTGTNDLANSDYVSNNGTDNGVITITIPTSDSSTIPESVLYYQCVHHAEMVGKLVIRDLEYTKFDPQENLENVSNFIDYTGLELSNSMLVSLGSDVIDSYANKTFYIEQVGKRITLVDQDKIQIYESFASESGNQWDENGIQGWDTLGFDNSTGQLNSPDYWTINRASPDNNAWSRSNRWFHKSVIETSDRLNNTTTTLLESSRAKRPIIEFYAGIELFNHGTVGQSVDVIDSVVTDALTTVQNKIGFYCDGQLLRDGDTVVFTKDPDTNNKIFTVRFVEIASSQVIQLVDDSTVVSANQSIVSKRGTNNGGKTFHYNGSEWLSSQQKSTIQQKPLFDVFDKNHVSLGNLNAYTSSNFTGTTLFEIATSNQGTPDTVYGKTVIYERLGLVNDIRINDTFNTGTFQYVSAGKIVEEPIRQYHFHLNKPGYIHESLNNWKLSKVKHPQKIIKIYTAGLNEQYFVIDHYKLASSLTDLTVQVLLNGNNITGYTQQTINETLYIKLDTGTSDGDVITVKAHSTVGVPSGKGFFEVPVGIQRNSLNKNITKTTLGDMIKHYQSAVENIEEFTGTTIGENNSRDIDDVLSYGLIIMQHSGSMPLASVFASDNVLNIAKAMRYSSREYEKIKKSLIDKVNGLSLDGTVAKNLDLILQSINENKSQTMPFYDTDMLSYSDDKKILTYTVVDSSIIYYPITNNFDLSTLSKKSVLVYLNDTQLVHGTDYVFTNVDDSSNQVGVRIDAVLSVDDIIKVVEYETTKGSFIPATPAKLGLAPKFKPEIYYDSSYQLNDDSTQVQVIKGHDGSITVAYGDLRDNILLEFEKRIYNNIKTNFDPDLLNIDYGFFRENEYTSSEIDNLLARDFFTWSGVNAIDYSTNATFNASNEFTYNNSKSTNSVDGSLLQGYWRAIYKKWFDTDTPHLTPWEMFGFSEKPAYWDDRYGPAPYTKGNTILWNDVADGFIAGGSRQGYYKRYARGSAFLNVIPVSDTGDLLSPYNAGIIASSSSSNGDLSAKWLYGDQAPPETAWRRSSSFRFAEQIAKFLAKPAKYAGLFFDTSRIGKNFADQIVYENKYRVEINQLKLPIDNTLTSGYINTIFDYITHLGYTPSTYVALRLGNLSVQLSYKLGGFSNKSNLQVVVGSSSPSSNNKSIFVPNENYNFLMYKSAPIVSVNYSGVIVEKSSGGYKVSGYSNFDRTFKYFQPKISNNFVNVRVGATTEKFSIWQGGGFYVKGSVVKNGSTFYRANANVSSGQTFSEDDWSVIGNTLPFQGGVIVKKYKDFLQVEKTIPYGTEFKNIQEVSDFLYGYEKYLVNQGFVFDQYSKELETPLNWDISVKEFLFWTTQNWALQSVITLSPASSTLKFIKANTVGDDLTDAEQYYTVLQQDGLPINPNNLSTDRRDGEFIINTNPDEDGIYNADIRAVQKEHLLVLDNITSFSDVLFDLTIGNRQDRVKLVGFKTASWNGDMYAPGGIIDRGKIAEWESFIDYKIGDTVQHQSRTYVAVKNHTSSDTFDKQVFKLKTNQPSPDLLPNWDSKAESFRDFYSLDTDNFDAVQQKYAQHLIGYQNREYFDNLGLDELTQYKFYQGMIRDKGTVAPIQRFKSSVQSNQNVTYDVFEEYAFRLGEYGGHRTLQEYEFPINESDHLQQKQVYQITNAEQTNTDIVINVSRQKLLKTPRVFSTNVFNNIEWLSSDKYPQAIFQYPMAGYPQTNQVDQTVWDEDGLLSINSQSLIEGFTVWQAKTSTDDWDVLRFNTLNLNIIDYKHFDNRLQIECDRPHGLQPGDIVGITNLNTQADGVYKIIDLSDSTDNLFKFTVLFAGTVDSTTSRGVVGKFQSIRIADIDSIDDIRPPKDFITNDYVYVDNGYLTNSNPWKVYSLSDSGKFVLQSNDAFDKQIIQDSQSYGKSISVSDDDKSFVIGSTGNNIVYLFNRNTTDIDFALRNEISLLYGNDAQDDQFGYSTDITSDGASAFAGAPYTSDIVKLSLSSTARIFTVNSIVTGSDSGATGRVLYANANEDYLIVKVTSATNFTLEGIDAQDSSSIVTITEIEGSDAINQGQVKWIKRDSSLNYGVQQTITAPNLDQGGTFGYSVSVSENGKYLAVGAPGGPNDSSQAETGRVYMYEFSVDGSTAEYSHVQTIDAGNLEIGSRFGEQVRMSKDGTTMLVISKNSTDSTTANAGRVYVYNRVDSIWYQTGQIVSGIPDNTGFGSSVAISELSVDVLIGSPNETNEKSNGVVYHFARQQSILNGDGSTTEFTPTFNLQDVDTFVTDGTNVYVKNDGSTTPNYSLDITNNKVTLSSAPDIGTSVTIQQYQLIKKLKSRKYDSNEAFGTTVTLKNNTLAVHSLDGDAQRLTTFDSLAQDGSTVLTSTTFDAKSTNFISNVANTGSVHIFSKYDTSFIFDQYLTESDLKFNDQFGSSLSLSNKSLYVSAISHDYIDNDSTRINSGRVYNYVKSSNNKAWNLVASQPDVVNVDRLKKSFGYYQSTKLLTTGLPFIDPAKGKLFPEVEQNISYKTPYDPADYQDWDNEQVGKLWFDLSTIKFLWYEQGDLESRYQTWGKLHPSSQVNIYEWTQSDVTPTSYNVISNSNEGISQGITGTAQSQFVTRQIFDDKKNSFVNKYYYWVLNPTTQPSQVTGRTLSASQVAQSINNPNSFSENWIAAIRSDSLLLSLRQSLLTDSDFVLHFENVTEDSPLNLHTEHVIIAKGDTPTIIPLKLSNKFHDSLIGKNINAQSVPDLSLPQNLRYGCLDRPRQSWYKNRNTALKSIVQYVNEKMLLKPYAIDYDISKLLSNDPIPNILLGYYDITVDTEVDLNYLNLETRSSGFKVLVKNDSTAKSKWKIYEYNGTQFIGIQAQKFDTSDFWNYTDWYAQGYDKDTMFDYVVDDEKTRLITQYVTNDIVKVRSSYDGNFRVYLKTYDSWQTIGIENATISLSTSLYDFATGQLGYGDGAFDFELYDVQPESELRNILEWLRDDLVEDDSFNYNELFFLGVRLAQIDQKDIDWVFKSSFIKIKNTFDQLSQTPDFQINTSDAVRSFLEEVLPFKTQIRQEDTVYRNLETFAGDITDFDNKSYYNFDNKSYVAPKVFTDDSTYFDVYNSNPWKQYSDNYKYNVGSIIVSNAGSGYISTPTVTITGGGGSGATAVAVIIDGILSRVDVVNKGSGYTSTPTVTISGGGSTITATAYAQLENKKIRKIDSQIKFDRVNTLRETTSNAIVDWQATTQYTIGQNIRYQNEIYRVLETFTSGVTFEDNVLLSDSSSVVSSAPLSLWTATDRIHAYYDPSQGMAGLIGDGSTSLNAYAQLMTGIEYPGVKVLSNEFSQGSGYDVSRYDELSYDAAIEDPEVPAEQLLNLDQVLDSKTFTTTLGSRAEDINVVGDAFISEYSAHAPEEVLPGGVYDTLDMKVFTKATDGASLITTKNFYGDGSTTTFSIPQPKSKDGVRVFVNNQFKKLTTDYTISYTNKTITFTTAPVFESLVSVSVQEVAVDNLLDKNTAYGDGSTVRFTFPVSFSIVTQSYVLVNGVKTSVTLEQSNDSASTDVIFAVAPDDGTLIDLYFFDLPVGTKAFGEVVQTEYTLPTDSTEIKVQLNPVPSIVGPHHHKAIVEGIAGTTSTNRYRLAPPQIKYYTGDGSSTAFNLPDKPQSTTGAVLQDVEVWVNGILQSTSEYVLSSLFSGEKAIQFAVAPTSNDNIAVVYKSGHDYEIDANGGLTMIGNWSDGSTINNEKVVVTTFSNHDQLGMRTEVFAGATGRLVASQSDFGLISESAGSSLDYGDLNPATEVAIDFGQISAGIFSSNTIVQEIILSATPLNSDYVFVSVNKQNKTINFDWRLEGNKILLPKLNLTVDDIITVTYITGTQSKKAIGYRIFKDILNRYHYRRLSSVHSTTLTQGVAVDDTTITVSDGSVLPTPSPESNTPGVVFIGTERIAYFGKSGNTLSQLYRGTLGTGVQTHAENDYVVDASLVQEIPYEDTTSTTLKTGDGSTVTFDLSFTPSSTNEITVFVGGTATTSYTLAQDSARSITFNSAPNDGVQIRVVRKTGSVWYDQGISSATNGLGLQQATTKEVEFLQATSVDLNILY